MNGQNANSLLNIQVKWQEYPKRKTLPAINNQNKSAIASTNLDGDKRND